ncbi:MAG TPA: oligosaccharide flippase family protein [Solirubrobacteraceae bacterium]|nr:oligosaccharide flippase family protein [Solirubrobacteraceae bacterium]
MSAPGSSPALRGAALHGLRWASLSRPATEIAQLGAMIALAHLLVPAAFGRYAVALIAQEAALILVSSGLGAALVQRAALRREHLSSAAALALLGGAALAGLMILLSYVVIEPLFDPTTALYVRLLAPLCLISALGAVPSAMLGRRLRFRRLSEIEFTSALCRAGTSLAFALAGTGGESLIFGSIAAGTCCTLFALASVRPPLPRLERAATRELLRGALPISASAIGWIGFSNIDYAIVGARLGALQAGLYFRAYTLSVEYQKKLSVVLAQVGFPVFARSSDIQEMIALRRALLRFFSLAIFPSLALLAIYAPTIVPIVFGARWAPAATPAAILTLGGAATLGIDAVGAALMASSANADLLRFGVGHFLVYGAAVALAVPFGIVAVAAAASTVHVLFLLIAYRLLGARSGEAALRGLAHDLGPAASAALAMLVVSVPLRHLLAAAHLPAVAIIIAAGLLAAGTYFATLALAFPASTRAVRSLLGELLRRPSSPGSPLGRRPELANYAESP